MDRIPLNKAPAISGIAAPSFDKNGTLDSRNDPGMAAEIMVVKDGSQAAPATGSSEVADH